VRWDWISGSRTHLDGRIQSACWAGCSFAWKLWPEPRACLCAFGAPPSPWAWAGQTSLPLLGWLFWLYFAYAGLALGGLLHAGRGVAALLRAQDITAARAALAGLVSRDVRTMDEQGLRRTLAETISENLNDAFVAPFLYLVCLGPAGLWAYKTVSTMDSMWGYTTVQWRELGWAAARQWRELGWAAARADDLLAFVPARLSALSLMAAHWLSGHGHRISWSELRRTAAKTDSPNDPLFRTDTPQAFAWPASRLVDRCQTCRPAQALQGRGAALCRNEPGHLVLHYACPVVIGRLQLAGRNCLTNIQKQGNGPRKSCTARLCVMYF